MSILTTGNILLRRVKFPEVAKFLRQGGSSHQLDRSGGYTPERRAVVETLLAEMLGVRRDGVSLEFRGGKPSVRNHPNIHCSYSHTLDDLVVGVTEMAPLGVDIERLSRLVPNAAAIAAKHFHPLEVVKLHQSVEMEREFLRIWCLKEAWVKAIGGGIAKDFRHFSVIDEDGQTRLNCSSAPAKGWLVDTTSATYQEHLMVGMALVGVSGEIGLLWC